jgi:hypothetical protein
LFLISQRLERGHGGLADKVPQRATVGEAQNESDRHSHEGAYDASAELFQMLEERHTEHAVIVLVATISAAGWGRRWRRLFSAPAGPPRKGS